LGLGTLATDSQRVASLVQRLRELRWIEGRTVAIEYRWAEGRPERFAEIATEFVRLKVNAIVAAGTPAIIAAKQATSVVPIVFVGAGTRWALASLGPLGPYGGSGRSAAPCPSSHVIARRTHGANDDQRVDGGV
jgi:hypothetical protein